MNKLPAILLTFAALASGAAVAQAPAGTDQDGRGSAASGSGNPGSQQPLDTHEADGKVRIEDGREVRTEAGDGNNDGGRDDSAEHSGTGGPSDPSSDPGSIE